MQAESDVADHATTRWLARAGLIGIAGALGSALFGWLRVKGLALILGPAGVGLYGQFVAAASHQQATRYQDGREGFQNLVTVWRRGF